MRNSQCATGNVGDGIWYVVWDPADGVIFYWLGAVGKVPHNTISKVAADRPYERVNGELYIFNYIQGTECWLELGLKGL